MNNVALVTTLSGNPVEVVIGGDIEALEERGAAFVQEQGVNAEYHLREVEFLRPGRPAVFHPYPNPGATVEILQSIGNLHLARHPSIPGLGLNVLLWEEPCDAEPDPKRPGYLRGLRFDEEPVEILTLKVLKRYPRQQRRYAVECTAFPTHSTKGLYFCLSPESAAELLTRFGFDPAPLWADVEAAGWDVPEEVA